MDPSFSTALRAIGDGVKAICSIFSFEVMLLGFVCFGCEQVISALEDGVLVESPQAKINKKIPVI